MNKNITREEGASPDGRFINLNCICGSNAGITYTEDTAKEYAESSVMYKLNRYCRFVSGNSCKRVYPPSCIQKIKDIKRTENEMVC